MKRAIVLGCLLAAVAAAAPSHADAESYEGSIMTSALTPTVPRSLYMVSERANGLAGWVTPLRVTDEARTYRLEPLMAGAGTVDLDVWFYHDLEGHLGTGEPCARAAQDLVGGGEEGTACTGAAFAVIVLFAGADVTFRLTLE